MALALFPLLLSRSAGAEDPAVAAAAAFDLEPASGAVVLWVHFVDRSTGADRWHWEFGDGATSDARDPVHLYVRPGLFLVQLEACNAAGCDHAVATVNVSGVDVLDGGRVHPGRPVYGAINEPGDTDTWTFSGVLGDRVTVTLEADTASPLDPILRLFGPDAALLAFNDDFGAGPDARIADFSLPSSGTFTLETSGFLATLGVYRLRLEVMPHDAVFAAFEAGPAGGAAPLTVEFRNTSRNAGRFEWDFGDGATTASLHTVHRYTAPGIYTVTLTACGIDDCATATATIAVEPADPRPLISDGPVRGALEFQDDIDTWTFAAPAAAEITLDFISESGAFDPFLTLIGPGGVVLTTDDDGGEGLNSRIANFILAATGAYSVDVTALGEGTGPYTLALTLDPTPAVRAAVAVTAPSFTAPTLVTFVDRSLGGPTSWSWTFDDGATLSGPEVQREFPEPGTFVVTLTACNPFACDSWSVRLDLIAESDGGAIALDQSAFGAIDPPGDEDVWTFAGTAGQVVTVAAVSVDPAIDLALEIIRPSGAVLAADDDSGGNLQPLIEAFTLPEEGEYRIRVYAVTPETTTRYEILLAAES